MKNKMNDFEDIRCIHDNEMPAIIKGILANKDALRFLKSFDLNIDSRTIIPQLRKLKTVYEFQTQIIAPLFLQVFENTMEAITDSGREKIPMDRAVFFISNHRDIVLESGLINLQLFKGKLRLANAGIGNNLLMNDTMQSFFKLMKCFVIRRDLAGKEQIRYLRRVSEYLRYTILENKESIWLAQNAGRAKDGNDRTNPAILKMITMTAGKDIVEYLQSLYLVPVVCSYEWEPCDIQKAQELMKRKRNTAYVKAQNEDLASIKAGISEPKGRVHVAFSRLRDSELEKCRTLPKKEKFIYIAQQIDQKIIDNYKLWPSNYIAADLFSNSSTYASFYTNQEKQVFVERMEEKISNLKEYKKEIPKLFLSIYANPVFNKKRYHESDTPLNGA